MIESFERPKVDVSNSLRRGIEPGQTLVLYIFRTAKWGDIERQPRASRARPSPHAGQAWPGLRAAGLEKNVI